MNLTMTTDAPDPFETVSVTFDGRTESMTRLEAVGRFCDAMTDSDPCGPEFLRYERVYSLLLLSRLTRISDLME